MAVESGFLFKVLAPQSAASYGDPLQHEFLLDGGAAASAPPCPVADPAIAPRCLRGSIRNDWLQIHLAKLDRHENLAFVREQSCTHLFLCDCLTGRIASHDNGARIEGESCELLLISILESAGIAAALAACTDLLAWCMHDHARVAHLLGYPVERIAAYAAAARAAEGDLNKASRNDYGDEPDFLYGFLLSLRELLAHAAGNGLWGVFSWTRQLATGPAARMLEAHARQSPTARQRVAHAADWP